MSSCGSTAHDHLTTILPSWWSYTVSSLKIQPGTCIPFYPKQLSPGMCEGDEEMAMDFQLQKGTAWTCVRELCWKPAYSTTKINTWSFQERPWFLYSWKYPLPLCRILLQWRQHQRIKALHSVSDRECTLVALVFLICADFEEAIKTRWLLQRAAQKYEHWPTWSDARIAPGFHFTAQLPHGCHGDEVLTPLFPLKTSGRPWGLKQAEHVAGSSGLGKCWGPVLPWGGHVRKVRADLSGTVQCRCWWAGC